MNQLNPAKRAQVIAGLVEGNSIRATVRMTGASKNAIQRLLAAIGPACEAYQNHTLRNLPCKKIQCDEIWSFCYAKQKNVPADKQGQFGVGDVFFLRVRYEQAVPLAVVPSDFTNPGQWVTVLRLP